MFRTRTPLLVASAVVLATTPAGFAQAGGGSADPVPVASRAVRFAVSEAIRPRDGEIDPLQATKTAPPAPLVSFDGPSNADNLAAFSFQVAPASPNLDVGPNHVVAATNLLVRVYDKAGNPLTAPFKQSALFAPLGGTCASRDDGDPIVLYDPLADRWLISQAARPTTLPPYSMCIAISQSADPTGAYFLYQFIVGGPTGTRAPVGPKLGVWPDGYYLAVRQFTNGTTFASAGAAVFDRLAMLRGDPGAQQIYFDLSAPPDFDGMLPSDLDGPVPPPIGTPSVFAYFTAGEFGDPGDALKLYDFHADFVTPASSTFTERPESPLAVAAFDPISPAGRNDIAQPGTLAKLDSVTDFLMHRMQYRHRGGFESLVVNHTVDASGDPAAAVFRAGVRVYELRRNTGAANAISVFEQATFAPDTANRWVGSAAVDNDGNLAFGYSVASATVSPSIRYAGKLAGEAVASLAETLLIAGTGVQTSTTLNRWGEHSMLAVDPSDDCTFWYTQAYYTAASQAASSVGWLTRIASFRYSQCTAPLQGTLQGTITDCVTGQPLLGALVTATGGYAQGTSATGAYRFPATAAGTYTVTASDLPSYGPVSQAGVIVGSGGTTTVDVCLVGTPLMVPAGATLVPESESCVTPNGAIDPGESVAARLCVQNTGGGATTNLVATLQATGGVTTPSGPQSYGAVAVGGPPVCRFYTLTAGGSCGGTLTASLQLRDGATDLGTVTYTFALGSLGPPAQATYSSGNIAVPIPDLGQVDVPIPVADTGVVTDVNVRLRLNHTFDGDLDLELVAPDGTIVPLARNRGGSGANFGTGTNNCAGVPTVFDEGAASPISAGTAPFAASFRPEQSLAAMNGSNVTGNWTLRARDEAALDTGTIGCVQLEIARLTRVCCVSQGLLFHTLDPCRVVDTRPGSGAPIGGPILTSGMETTLVLANTCGIPPTARAVSANLTAVGPTGPGFLVFYPVAGAPTPTSNLSFKGGFIRANNAMLGLNTLGQTQVLAIVNNPAGADEVHLVLDVNGYFE